MLFIIYDLHGLADQCGEEMIKEENGSFAVTLSHIIMEMMAIMKAMDRMAME